MNYDVTSNFNVNAGAAYTDAEYTKIHSPFFAQCFPSSSNPNCGGHNFGFFFENPTFVNLTNAPMSYAPKVTANLGARYHTDLAGGGLVLSSNLYYTSKFHFDPSHQYSQNGYELLGLRAEWTNPSGLYTLAVYGDNVTDTNYRTYLQATQGGIGNAWGAPAMYGAEVKVHF